MKPSNLKSKINTIVGSIGAFIGIFVFIAYIPQIIANISGAKGQPWLSCFYYRSLDAAIYF